MVRKGHCTVMEALYDDCTVREFVYGDGDCMVIEGD